MSRVQVPSIAHFLTEGFLTLIQALILGLVQGFSEFFPISSSAHLRLAKFLMGIPDGEHLLYFDLVCHSGSLLALLWYLRKSVWQALSSRKSWFLFSLALLPLVPAYFLGKSIRTMLSEPQYLGYFLMLTAALLFAASRTKDKPVSTQKTSDVLCIGAMQAMSLIPGISRSGSTIAMARFLGWNWVESARFSFLLSIPAILGGQLLETIKWIRTAPSEESLSPLCYASGFLFSWAAAAIAIRCIFWIYEKGKVRPFAWYCLGLGLIAWTVYRS